MQYDTITNQLQNDQGKLILGSRNYELTNHLGNVLAVISDKKILNGSTFEADIVSANDYYPFGMTIESRSFNGNYRFGFQGQESEKELFGGNGSFFKYRISDNRLGRFFSIDPLASKYPWNSTYAFSENKLIAFRELEGLEAHGSFVKKDEDGVVLDVIYQGDEIRVQTPHGYEIVDHHKAPTTTVMAVNVASGFSLGGGGLYGRLAGGLHAGIANDNNGNIMLYSSTEHFLDGVWDSKGGNAQNGEWAGGVDGDLIDLEGGYVKGDFMDYLNTTDITVDVGPFSISFAYKNHHDFWTFNQPDGIKLSVSAGWGYAITSAQTDANFYMILNEYKDFPKLLDAYTKLQKKTGMYGNYNKYGHDVGYAADIIGEFRYNKDTNLYRYHLYQTLDGVRKGDVDTGIDFNRKKIRKDKFGNDVYGYESTNMNP